MFEHDVIVITSSNVIGIKLPDWRSNAMQNARNQIMAQEDALILEILDNIFETEHLSSNNDI